MMKEQTDNGRAAQRITYVGHATVLIEMDGARLLTDPVLRGHLAHLAHRTRHMPLADFQDIDAVLISHLHWDHLDWPSLDRLGRHIRLIVPGDSAVYFARQGFTNVEELRANEETAVNGLKIRATPAVHDGRRHPKGPSAQPNGYLVDGRRTIYFAGDTDIFPEMADLSAQLDVALLPVWGWGPTLGKGHLDPERAALALTLLRPQIAIPIHWGALHPIGMGLFNPAFLRLPPLAFARRAAELAPEVHTHILSLGDTLSLVGINAANNGAPVG
ncbi:MAG: MBL fold metallo-hydrolase [Chloroflexi bacterium]|nr:MBL fold metallo-hydrolase [Chloroflexota bacterium]